MGNFSHKNTFLKKNHLKRVAYSYHSNFNAISHPPNLKLFSSNVIFQKTSENDVNITVKHLIKILTMY